MKLFGGGLRRAGHARNLAVHPEVVLDGDLRVGARFFLNKHAFLGFDGLVEPPVVASAMQNTPRKLVHDEHLVVFNHVILVFSEERPGLQGLLKVVHQADILGAIQILYADGRFGFFDARIRHRDAFELLVDVVIDLGLEPSGHSGKGFVEFAGFRVGRGDNERRPGLVYENGVNFVDNGEVMTALDLIGWAISEVVAQIIETELMIRAVGDVASVGLAARDRSQKILLNEEGARRVARGVLCRFALFLHAPFGIIEERAVRHEARHRKSQGAINLSHPHRIAASEIFVDRHDVNAPAGQGIKICRRDAGQGLAFTGHHLGHRAAVKH